MSLWSFFVFLHHDRSCYSTGPAFKWPSHPRPVLAKRWELQYIYVGKPIWHSVGWEHVLWVWELSKTLELDFFQGLQKLRKKTRPNVFRFLHKRMTHSSQSDVNWVVHPSVTEWRTEYRIPFPNRLTTSSKADWPKRPVEVARPPFLVEESLRNPTTSCHETFGRHLEGILEGAWCVVSAFSEHCLLSHRRTVARAIHNGLRQRRSSKWPTSQTPQNFSGRRSLRTWIMMLSVFHSGMLVQPRQAGNFAFNPLMAPVCY